MLARRQDGLTLALRVTPKAASNRIQGITKDSEGTTRLKVQVTALPDKGAANAAVINLLAKTWGLPKSTFSLLSGATGRNKVVRIVGEASQLENCINRKLEMTHVRSKDH